MFDDLSNYRPANPALWQGRKDTTNQERFFQKITFIDNQNELMTKDKKTIFLGFASDAGIKRNLGRTGAKLGLIKLKPNLPNYHAIIINIMLILETWYVKTMNWN